MRKWITAAGLVAAMMLGSPSARAEQQGVTDNEILLGSIQALSGPVASWGVPIANGLRMAVDDINSEGGIHGRKLRIILEDDQYDPRKTLQAADKLIKHDKIFAFLCNLGTPQNLALVKVVERTGVPLIFPQTADPKAWTPISKLRFGFLFPNPEQGVIITRYLLDTKKYTKLGVIYQDDELGKSYLSGIEQELEKRGVELAASASIKRNEIDASSQVMKLKAAGVDAIIQASVIPVAVAVLKERAKLNWDVDVVITSSGYATSVVSLAGAAAEGAYAMGQVPVPYPDLSPELADWNKRYQERFGEPADLGALFGYQTTLLIKQGLEKAGKDLTVDSLAAGLEQIKDYTDFFGTVPYSLSKDDHLAAHGVFLFQVKNGRWVKASDYIPLGQ
ncbi:ABC transporter substrate-binding protein [Rhodoligotrophos ferricapiens]|uniref:ABC transporter substrate-binding protein n=1 Tax=Rhodoligotrophos ferricapiens TaxID=3069264 RepID=UPI00315C7ECA